MSHRLRYADYGILVPPLILERKVLTVKFQIPAVLVICVTTSLCHKSLHFLQSGVRVVLADRTKSKPGFLKEQTAGTCYTHSQKFVVLDVPGKAFILFISS